MSDNYNGHNNENNSGYRSSNGNPNSNYRANSNNNYNRNPNNNRQNYQKTSGFKRDDENFDESSVRLYKSYVGTGNRDAPREIIVRIKSLVTELEQFGFILRTGGMDGPEDAFNAASMNGKELHVPFLPWKDYTKYDVRSYFNTKEVMVLAKMFQPTFDGLKPVIQAFLGKNVRMLLGKDLKSPAMFVVCWSEDGAESPREKTPKTGNIGHILAIAHALKIPVFNLAKQDAESRLRKYLEITENDNGNITEF